MTLQNMKEIFIGGGGALLILMTIIQIAPIKFNPWSFLAKKIGRAINGEVIEKVDNLGKELADHKAKSAEREATLSRTHILRFGDEILHDIPHSKEHYQQILIDIDAYEEYCNKHPDYRNNVAVETIKHIKRKYREHLENDSFL